jgi:hypothetical protein
LLSGSVSTFEAARGWLLREVGLTEAQIGAVLHTDPSIFCIAAGDLVAIRRRLLEFGVRESHLKAIVLALADIPGRLRKVAEQEGVIEASFEMIREKREELSKEEMAEMIERHPNLLATALDPGSMPIVARMLAIGKFDPP